MEEWGPLGDHGKWQPLWLCKQLAVPAEGTLVTAHLLPPLCSLLSLLSALLVGDQSSLRERGSVQNRAHL